MFLFVRVVQRNTFTLLAIGQKRDIILPSLNFVAAENMSKLIGVNIFADVDEKTGQVNYETLVNCVVRNK